MRHTEENLIAKYDFARRKQVLEFGIVKLSSYGYPLPKIISFEFILTLRQ